MSRYQTREAIEQQAVVVAGPRRATGVDRTFELPRRLYAATVALYLGFLAVMAAGFSSSGLVIPMAIFALFIIAGFGVPAIWAKMKPEHTSRSMTWGRFQDKGIMTATGRLSAREASAQMLILPILIFVWGTITVSIAALT